MRREMLWHWIVVVLCCFCVFGTTRIEGPSRSMSEKSKLIDSYGDVRFNDEKARLDNFAVVLATEPPDAKGYIIGYGGSYRARKCHGLARGNRARRWLVEMRTIDARRVIVVDGGFRDTPATELWLVRNGEEIPKPSETVARKSVRFSGPSLCGPAGRSYERAIFSSP